MSPCKHTHLKGLDVISSVRAASLCMAISGVISGSASAQDAIAPAKQTITLTNYAYTPSVITLKANVPVTLHLVNNATKSHDFSAPEFFAGAAMTPAEKSKVVDGAIDLDDGQTVDVTLTPHAGTYALTCTHFMHSMLGMTGKIIVQ